MTELLNYFLYFFSMFEIFHNEEQKICSIYNPFNLYFGENCEVSRLILIVTLLNNTCFPCFNLKCLYHCFAAFWLRSSEMSVSYCKFFYTWAYLSFLSCSFFFFLIYFGLSTTILVIKTFTTSLKMNKWSNLHYFSSPRFPNHHLPGISLVFIVPHSIQNKC